MKKATLFLLTFSLLFSSISTVRPSGWRESIPDHTVVSAALYGCIIGAFAVMMAKFHANQEKIASAIRKNVPSNELEKLLERAEKDTKTWTGAILVTTGAFVLWSMAVILYEVYLYEQAQAPRQEPLTLQRVIAEIPEFERISEGTHYGAALGRVRTHLNAAVSGAAGAQSQQALREAYAELQGIIETGRDTSRLGQMRERLALDWRRAVERAQS